MSKYVVIDLEMCRVPDANWKKFRVKQEVIQIGAVLLDEEYGIIDMFSSYVKPSYGSIDPFIQELTGISNDTNQMRVEAKKRYCIKTGCNSEVAPNDSYCYIHRKITYNGERYDSKSGIRCYIDGCNNYANEDSLYC